MDPFAQPKTSKPKSQSSTINPFAKALAETEHSFGNQRPPQPGLNPFSEALARTGGAGVDDFGALNQPNQLDPLAQQRQLEEERKRQQKEALRRKLHDQVNPVDMVSVFSAREKRVAQELEKTRQELQALAKEIAKFYKTVDIATFEEVVNPGTEGSYHISFYQKLRNFIMLLRQHVRSATTWANQMTAKNSKKKKKKKGPSLDFGRNETKAVHDTMHHERSNAFSGG
ncbi:MAG TPA: DUF5660 family protein [Patescibacteria group bacterium]